MKKPKTQTLWAVVIDATGEIICVRTTRNASVIWCRGSCGPNSVRRLTVRRLTVPAFAPKAKKESK